MSIRAMMLTCVAKTTFAIQNDVLPLGQANLQWSLNHDHDHEYRPGVAAERDNITMAAARPMGGAR